MRKLVASFFISLDGVVEGPGPADDFELAGWTMPYWDDQIAAFADVAMSAADTMLLGRVTYQAFEAAFANSMGPDADTMNSYRRFVVSTTLDEATWGSTTIIRENVADAVAALKEEDGHDIGISGSGTLVQYLLNEGLIDELNLLVYPVVLGKGKRLFENVSNFNLDLVQATPTSTGVVLTTYRKA
jgi:dihydrofolate reductase